MVSIGRLARGFFVGFIVLGFAGNTASAITFSAFGSAGQGGSLNGQTLTIGTDGTVFEIDAYLGIAGQDLNGGFFGTAAQFSFDPLPSGLDYAFSASLSDGATDLTLRYDFVNNTGADILGARFLSYLDADIGTAFGESAAISGVLGPGQGFEVGTSFGVFPLILDNLLLGQLADENRQSPTAADGDVAMALSWDLGDLLIGASISIEVMISEDGSSLGGFALIQSDVNSQTTVTYSGEVRPTVPVPAFPPLLLMALGAISFGLARRCRLTDLQAHLQSID